MIGALSLVLVLWLDPGSSDPTAAVRQELARRGFDLGSPRPGGDGRVFYLAEAREARRAEAELHETLEALRRLPGVTAAGELVGEPGQRVRFFDGRVAIRFRQPVSEAEARAAGEALGLELVEQASRDGRVYRYETQLSATAVGSLARSASALRGIEDLEPGYTTVGGPATTVVLPGALYHRIPEDRNLVTVFLKNPGITSGVQNAVDEHGGTLEDNVVGDRWFDARFPATPSESAEEAMEDALKDLLALPEVQAAGPAVLGGPPGFVTAQLVVRFRTAADRLAADGMLEQAHLDEVRELPYVKHGYLFRAPSASYRIYDVADELIRQDRAAYAMPNVMTVVEDACADDGCFKATHQEYLRVMNVCEPRKSMTAPPWNVRLAVLDTGAGKLDVACKLLQVNRAIDFVSMKSCQPDRPANWCDTPACKTLVDGWNTGHGNPVSLIAAAEIDSMDTDLVGIAAGIELINARRWVAAPDVAYADALWWLAGGDPEWCRDGVTYACTAPMGADECTSMVYPCSQPALPDPLGSQRADIINLSHTRPDFLAALPECLAGETCALVCSAATPCRAIGDAAAAIHDPIPGSGIREGGAVLVAAVGQKTNPCSYMGAPLCHPQSTPASPACFRTDLAELPSTVGVGSVTLNLSTGIWEPYVKTGHPGSEYCLIQARGSFVDLVAPLGDDGAGKTRLCDHCGLSGGAMTFGESSAATAAVSGVVALMLQENTGLTAEQVGCILRKTANPDFWGDISSWPVPCSFVSGHSPCMGRGMVDTCRAVAMATACEDPADPECECPGTAVEATATVTEPEEATEPEEVAVRLQLEPSIHPAKTTLPSIAYDFLTCLARGGCNCRGEVECLGLDVTRSERRTVREAAVELCFGDRCFTLARTTGKWRRGETKRIPLEPQPEMLGYLLLRRPAEVRIVSGRAARRSADPDRP